MKRASAAAILFLLTTSAPVLAQSGGGTKADALFQEGKRLMSQSQFSAACPKFAESQRLDPGIGTMLWLGECHAKNGQIASAWATFHEAEALAAKTRDHRASVAREEASKLEPRMSKLTIDATAVADLANLEVKRDDVVLGKPLWGTAIPTDGGNYTISATASAKKRWETKIAVPNEKGSVTVKIPALDPAPLDVAMATPGAGPATGSDVVIDDPNRGRTQRILGIVAFGVGVVGVGVGSYFGLSVKSKNDESNDHCNATGCDDEGYNLRKDALSNATISDISFIAGGALMIGGAILYLTAPKASKMSVGATPFMNGGGAAMIRGTF